MDNWTDTASDWIALAIAAATLGGIVWAAVMRATRPLRNRLDEIKGIAEALKAERERVDDLTDRVAGSGTAQLPYVFHYIASADI